MSVARSSLSHPILWFVFGSLTLAGVTTFLGQNPQPQTARQPTAAAPLQSQPQNTSPTAPAKAQAPVAAPVESRGQAQPGQLDRAANRDDRANSSDSRQSRANRGNEQEGAWLGIYLSQRENEQGATVAQVYPAGPAARAGLQSGDVIQQINGQPITNSSELVSALEQFHRGDKAELAVLRNNEPIKLTATLGSRNNFIASDRGMSRFGSRGEQSDDDDEIYNFPLHAMELEHNRRNAEQHQRIENEIAQLRDEIRQLRETLQKR